SIDQRIASLKETVKKKWPEYRGSNRSAVRLMTWSQKAKGQEVPLEELNKVLDVLEKDIQDTADPDAKFTAAIKNWESVRKKYGIRLFRRDPETGKKAEATPAPKLSQPQNNDWKVVEEAATELKARVDLLEGRTLAKRSAYAILDRVSQAKNHGVRPEDVMAVLMALRYSIDENYTPNSHHPDAQKLWNRIVKKHKIPSLELEKFYPSRSQESERADPSAEKFRYQHRISQQLYWLKKAGKEWADIFDQAVEAFKALHGPKAPPEGAALNRAAANLFWTLKKRWEGLTPSQMKKILDVFQMALDGKSTQEEVYGIRSNMEPEGIPPRELSKLRPKTPRPPRPQAEPRDPLVTLSNRMERDPRQDWRGVKDKVEAVLRDLNGDKASVDALKDVLDLFLENSQVTAPQILILVKEFETAWGQNRLGEFSKRFDPDDPWKGLRSLIQEVRTKKGDKDSVPPKFLMMIGATPKAEKAEKGREAKVEAQPEVVPAKPVEQIIVEPKEGEQAGLLGLGNIPRFFTIPTGSSKGKREFQANLIFPNLKKLSFLVRVDSEGKLEVLDRGRGYLKDPKTGSQVPVDVKLVPGFNNRLRVDLKWGGPAFEMDVSTVG
ncbi:MAG: hypothetical protein R3257_07000, partial [bacterium]|nr:hypothetical protein [bacterium]